MLIYKVGCQFGHSFPTMLESFAFGVGTRCAYELYVRITCLDGLDKRFQTLEVKILPLFVFHCKILHVERCRVTVLHRTYRVFPLVTVLKCFAFDNTSARESQHSGVNIGKSLAEVAAHTVLAVLESVYGEEADVFECEGELSDVSAWVLDIRVAEGEICLARFVVCSKITPYLFIIITQAGLKMEKSDQDNLISLFKPVFIDFKALYGSIILFYKIHRCD